jgi:bacteriocin-like protein
VITHTSLITALHNNGFTGIDQPNIYSRGLKMTKQKPMTEKELDQISGGPHYTDFNGRPGVIGKRESRNVMVPD